MAAATRLSPTGMAAVLGGDADEVLAAAADLGLSLATVNVAGQVVLGGSLDALELLAAAPPKGARVAASTSPARSTPVRCSRPCRPWLQRSRPCRTVVRGARWWPTATAPSSPPVGRRWTDWSLSSSPRCASTCACRRWPPSASTRPSSSHRAARSPPWPSGRCPAWISSRCAHPAISRSATRFSGRPARASPSTGPRCPAPTTASSTLSPPPAGLPGRTAARRRLRSRRCVDGPVPPRGCAHRVARLLGRSGAPRSAAGGARVSTARRGAALLGLGAHRPAQRVDNTAIAPRHRLHRRLDPRAQRHRHARVAAPGEGVVEMAVSAGGKALAAPASTRPMSDSSWSPPAP